MIKQEELIINGKKFIKTYSDSDMYLKQEQTDVVYKEAIDREDSLYTYVEITREEYDKYLEAKKTAIKTFTREELLNAQELLKDKIKAFKLFKGV